MAENPMLTFSQFQQFLAEALCVDAALLKPSAAFLDGLGVESLKLVEMIIRLEIELGTSVPTEMAWEIQTVGDAYRYYCNEHSRDQPVSVAPGSRMTN